MDTTFRGSTIHHYISCSRSFTQLQSLSLGSPLYTTTCPVPGHSHSCSPHFWGLLCTSQHVLFPVIHTAAVLIFGVSSVHHNMSRSQSFTQVQSLSSGSAHYITMFCPQSFQQLQALSLGVSLYHMPCPQSFQQLQTLSLVSVSGFIVPHALSPVIQVAAIPVFRGFHCTSLYALSPVIQTAGVPLLRCFIIYHCHASLPVTQEAAVQSNLIQWCDGVAQ